MRTTTYTRYLFVFWTLLCAISNSALAELPQMIFGSASSPKVYELSCTELQCVPKDDPAHAVAIQLKEETLAAVRAKVTQLRTETGDSFELVFYPIGGKKGKFARRLFSDRIALKTDIARKQTFPEGVLIQPHRSAEGWTLVTYSSAADALQAYQALSVKYSRDVVLPLLKKMRSKRFIPSDPRFSYSSGNQNYQWHLRNTGQNGGTVGIDANIVGAWDTYLGNGITIGIVDDGLQNAHPDLAPNVNTALDHNWNSGNVNDSTPTATTDSHGTSCAGVAAARDRNGRGGVGAAPRATLVGLRLIAGEVSDADEAEALGWMRNDIDIYSNSWGPNDNTTLFEKSGPLFKASIESGLLNGRGGKGSVFVWAGGNGALVFDNSNYDGYANLPGTIAIGAIDDNGNRASYSERGANLVISAPSSSRGDQGVTTTTLVATNGGYTDDFGGTSSATPVVSGVIALMLESNPDLGWRDVQEILISTAEKVNAADQEWAENSGGFHFNHNYGSGIVDAQAAVSAAETWTNLSPRMESALDNQNINGRLVGGEVYEHVFDFSELTSLRVEHAVVSLEVDSANTGQLDVRLVSPDGMESRLSEPHPSFYSGIREWSFMSVRHWGAQSNGQWKLRISRQGLSGNGTVLRSAGLKIYGTASSGLVPQAPVITSSGSAQAFVGQEFIYQILGNWQPESFMAMNLPSWANIDGKGMITGVPDVLGTVNFTVSASNDQGSGSQMVTLEVVNPLSQNLAQAFDIGGLSFEEEGVSSWQVRVVGSQVGSTHLRTGVTNDSQSNSLITTVSFSQATEVSFWWRVSSERDFDQATFSVNGVVYAGISGSQVWRQLKCELSAGSHRLVWSFDRDVSFGAGTNSLSLDGLLFTPIQEDEPPSINSHAEGADVDLRFTANLAVWPELSHSGRSALASPPTANSLTQSLTAVVVGPGVITFDWACSTEFEFDLGAFTVDGSVVSVISGEQNFTQVTQAISSGVHELTWNYSKDSDTRNGMGTDAIYLDRMRYVQTGSYEAYADSIFSTSERYQLDVSAANADVDADGLSNMMEWVTGLDVKAKTLTPPISLSGKTMSTMLRNGVTGVNAVVEYSETLSDDSWQPVTSFTTGNASAPGFSMLSHTSEDDPRAFFYRMRVSQKVAY